MLKIVDKMPMRRDPSLTRVVLAADPTTARDVFVWCTKQNILCEYNNKGATVVCTNEQLTWLLLSFAERKVA